MIFENDTLHCGEIVNLGTVTFINCTIVMTSVHYLTNFGRMTLENSTIDMGGTQFRNEEDSVLNMIDSTCKDAEYISFSQGSYQYIERCTFKNITHFSSNNLAIISNSSFENVEILFASNKIFFNCYFPGPWFDGAGSLVNTAWINIYINDVFTETDYKLYQHAKIVDINGINYLNGSLIYEGNANSHQLLNRSINYDMQFNYTYTLSTTFEENNYTMNFTAFQNHVITHRICPDFDQDGIPDLNDTDMDNDNWTNEEEDNYHTDPKNATDCPKDLDGDHVPDEWDDDADGDGWPNYVEVECLTGPLDNESYPEDTDGDGTPDPLDYDKDGDLWSNDVETECDTDPLNKSDYPGDYDRDGFPDPLDDDIDGDGWNNTVEEDNLYDPWNEWSYPKDLDRDGIYNKMDEDRDGDGWNNTVETEYGTSPDDQGDRPGDMDLDGIPNGWDNDTDGDGVNNTEDHYPNDPTRWKKPVGPPDDDTEPSPTDDEESNETKVGLTRFQKMLIIDIVAIGCLALIILLTVIKIKRKRKKKDPKEEYLEDIPNVEIEG